MDKEQLLQELSTKIAAGEISREDILSRLGNTKQSMNISATKILYILGAAIVVLGIFFLIVQIWDEIGMAGHILTTFGLGLLLVAIGSSLLRQESRESLGTVFHFLGGVLIPFGTMVVLTEFGFDNHPWQFATAFGFVFLFYLLLNSVQKNPVLTFFSAANGTAFLYLLFESILPDYYYNRGDFYAYLTMVVGASYLFLAQAFRGGWNDKLVSLFNFIGSAAFLGAAFSRVFDSLGWQLLYFLIVLGGLFLAAHLKSRGILTVSTLFLLAHVSYITSEYFADSLGWPISLVLLGFVFIGLGYSSVVINRKYIK